MSQKQVLKVFKKTMSLVLSENGLKRNFYGPLTFLESCMPRKNLVLK